MPRPSDIALAHLKRALSRDPVLRDVLLSALPGMPKGSTFDPDADVLETPRGHVVLVDLPGVRREAVHVRIDGAHLVVEGTRSGPAEEGAVVASGERTHGPFRREFLLPPDYDAEGVAASLDDGVLRVLVPRRGGGPRSREVPITGEG